jgi:quercetin dioxygenase-like cupin family protein
MKHNFKYSILLLAISFAACTTKQKDDAAKEDEAALIFPKGEKINNDNFTGTAYLHPMVASDSLNPTQVGNVTFEPGARTKWHLHPGGQILLVTGGTGYYQENGQPKKILRKGDVVKCPPNIPHWHGASPDEQFIQVAITNAQNGLTVWLGKVTDSEYNSKGGL